MAICDPILCTGCAACANVCPATCITMQSDEEGFLRPQVDESRCIHCHLCEKRCPVNVSRAASGALECFAARVKDRQSLERSTSGGIFSAMAAEMLKQGGCVCGCSLDGDVVLRHRIVSSDEGLQPLIGVKYVQSEIGSCYRDIINLLNSGKRVFFCGTPCQVAALNGLVSENHGLLLTAQIICHGVPSPGVWKHYLAEQRVPVKDVIFRNKQGSWRHSKFTRFHVDGVENSVDLHEDGYLRLFLYGLDLRPSCYSCHFHENKAGADFTISDFWGVEKLGLGFDDDAGVSAVMVHTAKGQEFWKRLSGGIEHTQCSQASIAIGNPRYTTSFPKPAGREFCMDNYKQMGVTRVASIVLDGRCSQKRAYRNFKQLVKSLIGWKVK